MGLDPGGAMEIGGAQFVDEIRQQASVDRGLGAGKGKNRGGEVIMGAEREEEKKNRKKIS
jgi:hypothetical protein